MCGYAYTLAKHININYEDINIKIIDLYDIIIDVLEEKGYLDRAIQMEKTKGSYEVIEPIKRTMRLTLDNDLVVAKISEGLEPMKDVVFLVGVGKFGM